MGKLFVIVVPTLPDFTNFNYARLGAFSMSTNSVKYIASEDAVIYNGEEETVAYHYRKSIEDRNIHFPRKNFTPNGLSYPYYAYGARIPMGVYVDIRRAFQQIASTIGYEVWFREGKAFAYGETMPDVALLSQYKTARGLLVSGHSKESRYALWQYGKITDVKFQNKNYAPYLRYAIWRILHAVMTKLKPFVYYVHTDGVIINPRMMSRVDKIMSRYHLEYAIKHTGPTTVKAVGAYKIGDYESGTFQRASFVSRDNIIDDEHTDWWLEQFVSTYERRT